MSWGSDGGRGRRSGLVTAEEPSYAFVDAVARKNVELTMAAIRSRSAIIAELETAGAVKNAGAMYGRESAVVDFLSSTPRP